MFVNHKLNGEDFSYFNVSLSNFKILVSNRIYTFPPFMFNHFSALIPKNINSRSKNDQKSRKWEKPIFRLQTQIKPVNLHQSSILRVVLKTTDCAEFKTDPELENISKNG